MGSKNDNIGDQIRNAVQSAIDSQDFSSLVGTVGSSLNDAGARIREGMDRAAEAQRTAQQRKVDERRERELAKRRQEELARVNARFASASGKRTGGIVALVFGILFLISGVSNAISSVGLLLAAGSAAGSGLVSTLSSAIFSVGLGAFLSIWGYSRMKLAQRFEAYRQIIGSREWCNLSELATMGNRSESQVLKDIEKMLGKGMFRQGHLTPDKKTLLVSAEEFARYQAYQAERERMCAQQAAQSKADADRARAQQAAQQAAQHAATHSPDGTPYTKEQMELFQRGDAYVVQLRVLNDEIPGEEVSAKIYRIESLTAKIFQRAREYPAATEDLGGLMTYYLPITVKLLENYRDMDKQSVEVNNIRQSRQEIEKTLDVLVDGMEKILDDMFRDTAWEVASDATLLKTMLAREGLVGDPFEKMRKSGAFGGNGAGGAGSGDDPAGAVGGAAR